VLEHGWAYGSAGKALSGKRLLSLISTGGGALAYSQTGYQRATIRDFLLPIERTTTLCNMEYLPPYVIYGTHQMNSAAIEQAAAEYRQLLGWLHNDRIDFAALREAHTLNEGLAQHPIREAAV